LSPAVKRFCEFIVVFVFFLFRLPFLCRCGASRSVGCSLDENSMGVCSGVHSTKSAGRIAALTMVTVAQLSGRKNKHETVKCSL
jgi:hypothetical protein